jgi:hypothetical protein
LAQDLHARPRLQRGGIDVADRTGGRFSVELAGGLAGLDTFGHSRFSFTVAPRIRLTDGGRASLDLAIPILVVPGSSPDPRSNPCLPEPGLFDPCSLGDFPPEAVAPEIGPSFALAPSLEWTFHTGCCFEPSLFVGAGVWHDRGRGTPVAGDLRLTTEAQTSPLLTVGTAFTRPLTARTSLRIEGRVLRTFYDEATVTGPFGLTAEADAREVTTAVVTVGVRFHF